jgi:hypothetical protein
LSRPGKQRLPPIGFIGRTTPPTSASRAAFAEDTHVRSFIALEQLGSSNGGPTTRTDLRWHAPPDPWLERPKQLKRRNYRPVDLGASRVWCNCAAALSEGCIGLSMGVYTVKEVADALCA